MWKTRSGNSCLLLVVFLGPKIVDASSMPRSYARNRAVSTSMLSDHKIA
jgi:hypothetical protein